MSFKINKDSAVRTAILSNIQSDDELRELEKSRPTKYFKREGSPGNYKYYYTEEEYKKAKGGAGEAKKAAIGEVRSFGDKKVKKIAEGKWVEVSAHGRTKSEHEEITANVMNSSAFSSTEKSEIREINKRLTSNLSDREYSDDEVEKVGGKVETLRDRAVKMAKELGDHELAEHLKTAPKSTLAARITAMKDEVAKKSELKKESSSGFDQKKFNDAIERRDTNALISEANKMSDEQLEKTFEHHYQMASHQQPGHVHIVNILGKIRDARKEKKLSKARETLGLSTTLEKGKALPVGTINKYGEQKMGDGTWKYVGKKPGGGDSEEDKKIAQETVKRSTNINTGEGKSEELQSLISQRKSLLESRKKVSSTPITGKDRLSYKRSMKSRQERIDRIDSEINKIDKKIGKIEYSADEARAAIKRGIPGLKASQAFSTAIRGWNTYSRGYDFENIDSGHIKLRQVSQADFDKAVQELEAAGFEIEKKNPPSKMLSGGFLPVST